MKFIYETDRLILKLLGEDDAPAVLQFYKQNRNVFEPYETIHPEQFYTVAYQRTLMNCELSLTLKHSLIRFYIFRRENPDEIIGTVCFRNINRSTYYSCETEMCIRDRNIPLHSDSPFFCYCFAVYFLLHIIQLPKQSSQAVIP